MQPNKYYLQNYRSCRQHLHPNHVSNCQSWIILLILSVSSAQRGTRVNYYMEKGKPKIHLDQSHHQASLQFAISSDLHYLKGIRKQEKRKQERDQIMLPPVNYLDSSTNWECFLGRSCSVKSLSLVVVMISISASSLLIQDSWTRDNWRLVIQTKGNLQNS